MEYKSTPFNARKRVETNEHKKNAEHTQNIGQV